MAKETPENIWVVSLQTEIWNRALNSKQQSCLARDLRSTGWCLSVGWGFFVNSGVQTCDTVAVLVPLVSRCDALPVLVPLVLRRDALPVLVPLVLRRCITGFSIIGVETCYTLPVLEPLVSRHVIQYRLQYHWCRDSWYSAVGVDTWYITGCSSIGVETWYITGFSTIGVEACNTVPLVLRHVIPYRF